MFEELLFETGTQIKLEIFRSLSKRAPGQYTYQEISEATQLTYSQLTKGLLEIEEELTQANYLTQPLIRPNIGVVTTEMTISTDQYLEFLLKESLPYHFLLATLLEPELGLENFCKRHFISRSTLSRKMRKMTIFLKEYGIQISYHDFALTGREDKIRLFYYYFIYLCHHNLSWPFTISQVEAALQVEKFAKFFPQNGRYVSRLMLTIFGGVCITRIQQHKLMPADARVDFIFEANPHYDLNKLNNEYGLKKYQSQAEARFIYFICNFFPFYEMPEDPAIAASLKTFQTVANPVGNFGDRIVCFVAETLQLDLSRELTNLLRANLYNSLLAFYIFSGPFPNLISFLIPKGNHKLIENEFQNDIYLFLLKLTNEPEFQVFQKSALPLAKMIRESLLPLILRSNTHTRLRVAIASEPNYLLTFNLLNFLKELSFVDVAYFQEGKSYDLIISTLATLPTDKPIYYWQHEFGTRNLNNLYQRLLQQFMQKNGI